MRLSDPIDLNSPIPSTKYAKITRCSTQTSPEWRAQPAACIGDPPLIQQVAMTGRRWLAVGLVGVAVTWILVNSSVEGPVLLTLTPSHGITVADLASLALIIIAGFIFIATLE